MAAWKRSVAFVLWITAVIFPILILSVPIDFYNVESQGRYVDPRVIKSDPNRTEICKENINNDNITNVKWYRYHNQTHKCWHIDTRGPCGRYMLFYPIGNSEYGECDCIFYYWCSRPLIYWPERSRCYYTNDQGPCGEKEWLILNKELTPTCEMNPCLQSQTGDPSNSDRYWFETNGTCYKTLSQGYCKNPEEVLYPKWKEYEPSCNIGRICNSRSTRSTGDTSTACVPGQKKDQNGNCRAPVRLSSWFQYAFFRKR